VSGIGTNAKEFERQESGVSRLVEMPPYDIENFSISLSRKFVTWHSPFCQVVLAKKYHCSLIFYAAPEIMTFIHFHMM
jgi:hypothetical protein